jgi:carboxylesterase type B
MKIQSFYFGNLPSNSSNEDYLVNLTNLISDRTFYYPLKESALFHAKYAPTYLYYYQYNFYLSLDYFFYDSQNYLIHPALNMLIQHTWRFVKEFILRIPVMSEHTCHGDELPLFFTHPWTPTIFSWLPSRDIEMSRHLVKLWTDFASSR